jgi:hypothetical protein
MKFINRDDIASLKQHYLPEVIEVYGKDDSYSIGERIIINEKYIYTVYSYEVDLKQVAIYQAEFSGPWEEGKQVKDKENMTLQELMGKINEIIDEKVDEKINKLLIDFRKNTSKGKIKFH